MIPIVTPAEMASIDADAPEPVEELIDRAGRAVARVALDMLGGSYGRVVTVLAGSGNNGNDGRVAAEVLRRRGAQVHVVDAASRPDTLPPSDLVIDAAFGTGFHGEWTAPAVHRRRRGGRGEPDETPRVLAVDIPSGVDAATGRAAAGVMRADRTVTFQALKPGLLFGVGRHLSGEVVVVDIGLDVGRASRFLVERTDALGWYPRRPFDAHKWKAAVRVVAGSPGMLGAARLCADSAARAGASLVALSSPGVEAPARSEVIGRAISAAGFDVEVLDDLGRFAALAIGPGLGRAEDTVASVRGLLANADIPTVVDGDGLFAAACGAGDAAALVRSREAPTVLTPHDGEFAVLSGAPPGVDRIDAARTLAERADCTVLLKGPTTVVATPERPTLVVAEGDQRLATAGTGDVLTGIIVALIARGAPPDHAAAAGAWLHAAAARQRPGPGLLAGDIVDLLPTVLTP